MACVTEYDRETSIMWRPRPTTGCCAMGKKTNLAVNNTKTTVLGY